MLSVSFSICLPLYNGRQLLGETLESVRLQTHTDWELIVVEDASPEPSRDLVEAFATRVEQPVTYHVNPANLNCARSRDEAFRHAAHDFIAPLDQDDIWKPHHLAELARVFTATDPDFVFTSCVTFREDPTQIEADFTPAPTVRNRLRSAYFFLPVLAATQLRRFSSTPLSTDRPLVKKPRIETGHLSRQPRHG